MTTFNMTTTRLDLTCIQVMLVRAKFDKATATAAFNLKIAVFKLSFANFNMETVNSSFP